MYDEYSSFSDSVKLRAFHSGVVPMLFFEHAPRMRHAMRMVAIVVVFMVVEFIGCL